MRTSCPGLFNKHSTLRHVWIPLSEQLWPLTGNGEGHPVCSGLKEDTCGCSVETVMMAVMRIMLVTLNQSVFLIFQCTHVGACVC